MGRYGAAVLVVACAIGAWLIFGHELQPSPMPLFVVAVVITIRFLGTRAGGMTAIACAVTGLFTFSGLAPTIVQILALGAIFAVMARSSGNRGRILRDLESARAGERRAIEERLRLEGQKDAFFVAVAHDLKSPLTTIKGHAQLLARRLQTEQNIDRAKLAQGLHQIDALTTRMASAINGLIDVTHVQLNASPELVLRSVDLAALARSVVNEQQSRAGKHVIQLKLNVPEIKGLWDEFRVERVIGNLVANAVKYSAAGDPVLVEVDAIAGAGNQVALLRVTDLGIGIPETDLPHIFERFHRGSNVSDVPGSGIGLAGVTQIVELHGGTIQVESRQGYGSIFTVKLPLSAAGVAPQAEESSPVIAAS